MKVRTLLQLADERRRSCADVRVVAEAHLKDVRAKIADLKRMERALPVTVAGCVSGRRAHCPVIETLDRTSVPHVASRAVSARRARAGGSASATPA